jgi:hypothetical protein
MAPAFGDRTKVRTIARQPSPEGYGGELVIREAHGTVYVEPEFGYLITGKGRLIEDSVETNYPGKAAWRLALPSPLTFVNSIRTQSVQSFDQVVSLRHWWEWNYYHFYLDVLGKLAAYELVGLPQDVPVLIGRYATQLPWVKQLLGRGGLANRSWVIHDTGLIQARSVTYCRAQLSFRQRASSICSLVDAPQPSLGGRRIFLNRRGLVCRQLRNLDEVLKCLSQYDFEEVDTLGMPVDEQMKLFAETRHLVAIHGAGLVNVLYRRSFPLTVLELYGRGWNPFEFKKLCTELGYDWTGLPCDFVGPDAQLADIVVDVKALRRHLECLA